MTLPSPDMGIVGGGIRFCEGIVSATPTLLVGLLIAAILRYYYGPQGTRTLFGGESFRSLPQSWAIGMLLPVCSIGVIPILIEMRPFGSFVQSTFIAVWPDAFSPAGRLDVWFRFADGGDAVRSDLGPLGRTQIQVIVGTGY